MKGRKFGFGENSNFSKSFKKLWGKRNYKYIREKKSQGEQMKSRKHSSKSKCGRKINLKKIQIIYKLKHDV